MFRVFDSLNWVENMRVAMDAVIESGKLCEAAICYTGDLLDPDRAKYDLKYYVGMAKELRDAGAHVLGIKDMAGLLKPSAAYTLVKDAEGGGGAAGPLPHPRHQRRRGRRASSPPSRAGVDAVDAAMDSFSGNTSQPCLGSIVEALRRTERDTGLDIEAIRTLSDYWEAVRAQYAAFEAGLKAPASEVYLHEMPGGQFTNLKAQARSMGLEERWHEVAQMYAEVNRMFGDIVKVTPSLQGGRRHGADDGGAGADPRAGRGPGRRGRLPRERRRHDAGQPRPAAGRLAGGVAEEGAEGRGAARPSGRAR